MEQSPSFFGCFTAFFRKRSCRKSERPAPEKDSRNGNVRETITRKSVYNDALEELQNPEEAGRIADYVMENQGDMNESLFFDAKESMSDLNMGVYRPASIAGQHSASIAVMDNRDTLLHHTFTEKNSSTTFRSSTHIKSALEEPEVRIELRGYPGKLTVSEVSACMEFYKQLKAREDPVYWEMVRSFKSVETEPSALCRFLRARNFNVEHVFEMMEGAVDIWKEGRNNDFYPDADKAINAPISALMTQYPSLIYGNAKNGCPVQYFRADGVTVEGIECITHLDNLTNLAWFSMMHRFPSQVANAQSKDPNAARCEALNVIDLKGLSKEQINARTLGILQKMNDINVCFPEVLNSMVILNAPSFFSFFWRIIKSFIDKRTASKINIFSNEAKGNQWLQERVDKSELLSTYGGTGPSFESVTQKESLGPNATKKHQIFKLLHINNNHDASFDFDLEKDEQVDQLQVHTRSVDGADISLFKDGVEILEVDVSSSNKREMPTSDNSGPYCLDIASAALNGPGRFQIVLKSKAKSKGINHFLVIGWVN